VSVGILLVGPFPYHHTARLDEIIDSHMAKQEAARRTVDPQQDGGVVHAENFITREGHVGLGDV
jgi:hypothetical protein